jgi:hypothetical protein
MTRQKLTFWWRTWPVATTWRGFLSSGAGTIKPARTNHARRATKRTRNRDAG